MMGRLLFLMVVGLLALGVCGTRIYYLTLIRGDYFYELSENNFL